MTDLKTILCLANSWRAGGRCVAGKEVGENKNYGEWIRPVGSEDTENIEKTVASKFNILDIIEIPIKDKQEKEGHQVENYLIDPNGEWSKVRSTNYSDAQKALDLNPPQWMDGGSDSSKGKMDAFTGEAESSLCLIRANDFTVRQDDDGKRRASFVFDNKDYDLAITDATNPSRYYDIKGMDGVILCISLIGESNRSKTKLIAGIITPNMGN